MPSDTIDLHESLPWAARSGSIPSLPAPTSGWTGQLEALIDHIEMHPTIDLDGAFTYEGVATPMTFRRYVDALAPAGLLRRSPTGSISVTEAASRWRAEPSPEGLLLVLHRNVRYVGEILDALSNEARTIKGLLQHGNEQFRLGWTSSDQVRRRVKWLSELGFVEEIGDRKFQLTSAGSAVLPSLKIDSPDNLWTSIDTEHVVDVPPPGPVVQDLLDALQDDPLLHRERHRVLSYIPTGSNQSPIDSLRLMATAGVPEISSQDFEGLAMDTFGIKASSAKSALTTMRTSGLFVASGKNKFTATVAAREWLESGTDVDLVRILHRNVFFVGEVLDLVDTHDRSPDLSRAAGELFGTDRIDSTTVSRVLQIHKLIGAVAEIGYARYATTPFGRSLRGTLPMALPATLTTDRPPATALDLAEVDQIIAEVEQSSFDSKNPDRFEHAIAEAMRFLGVQARRIGGPGSTDVLVELQKGATTIGTAIIDAKSSGSGVITEKAISLPVISEHRAKHHAKFAAVVGPSFEDGRLHEWARKEEISLVSAEQLSAVLRSHANSPLSPDEIALLFGGPDGIVQLEELTKSKARRNDLVTLTMRALLRETQENDPILGSSLDATSLYRALRDLVTPRPTLEELTEVLDFLASPFLGILDRSKNGYEIRESIPTSAGRLHSLARAVADGHLNATP